MKWDQFLNTIENRNHERMALVGPLHGRPFIPSLPTIFVDGGADFRPLASDQPCVSVGDGDSAAKPLDKILPTRKDHSDLAFALRHLPGRIRELELFGFLGGRRDHEWANVGEVGKFLWSRPGFSCVRFYDDQDLNPSLIGFARGTLKLDIHGEFSVLALESEFVKISGACEYGLDGSIPLEALSSHGVSNVATGLVEITSTKPCFVFLRHQKS